LKSKANRSQECRPNRERERKTLIVQQREGRKKKKVKEEE